MQRLSGFQNGLIAVYARILAAANIPPCGKHNGLGDALKQNPSAEFAQVSVNQLLRLRTE
jgi:hypothetical protein